MKAFGEWWPEQEKRISEVYYPRQVIAGEAWRAALERVWKEIDIYESNECNIKAVCDFIAKELHEQA